MKLSDIKNYIDGNWRYLLYRTAPALLTRYVKQQFEKRQELARACLLNGECKHCGCKTPELFMANRACSKEIPCYESMKPLWKRIIGLWKNIMKINIGIGR